MWLELGGRGFDTAWEYGTQAEIAAAVKASGIPRSEIFITSKIPGSLYGGCCGCPGAKAPGEFPPCKVSCHGVCFPAAGHYTADNATQFIMDDLQLLGDTIGYIDLLLLHEPCDYTAPYAYNASVETSVIYGAIEKAYKAMPDKIKAIGVSNFDTVRLEALAKTNTITPAVDQCSMSVGNFDTATFQYCQEHNITYQGYSVLHGAGISSSATITSIAKAHGSNVSNQQVVMRWVTQKGIAVVTASNVSAYDIEDMAIFNFNLTDDEMKELDQYTPPSQCIPNKWCKAVDECTMDGCKRCGAADDGEAEAPSAAERAAVAFQNDVVGVGVGVGGKCNSCGCTKCCGKCVLKTYGKITYCANP